MSFGSFSPAHAARKIALCAEALYYWMRMKKDLRRLGCRPLADLPLVSREWRNGVQL